MAQTSKTRQASRRFNVLASTVILLSSCSEKPADEAEQSSFAGPQLSASAAPDVAFTYDYAFSLPNSSVALLQEQHASACEKLGPTRCRITGMRYDLVRGGDITGSLSVSLDRNIARAFGKDGIAVASRLGGKLTSASIDGQDMAAQIAAAKSGNASSATRIADLEKQLTRTDLGDRERSELREQLEVLRSSNDENRGAQSMAEAQVALTPMTMRYYGSGTLALSDNPLALAGAAFASSATSVLSLLLYGLAYGLPWLGLALAAVALWRTTFARKLRAYISPAKPEV